VADMTPVEWAAWNAWGRRMERAAWRDRRRAPRRAASPPPAAHPGAGAGTTDGAGTVGRPSR